jgi:hypothetical protein
MGGRKISMKRIMRKFSPFVLVLLLMGLTEIAFGASGKIAGKVTDKKTGEALVGCNVVEGTSMGAATDLDGFYTILNVPPGVYTLSVSLVGYVPTKVKDARVIIDLTCTIDVQLRGTVLEPGHEVVIIAERLLKEGPDREDSRYWERGALRPPDKRVLPGSLTSGRGLSQGAFEADGVVRWLIGSMESP